MFFLFVVCGYMFLFFFFFKQKTAYEMRISDWSSDVCSSDLAGVPDGIRGVEDGVGGIGQAASRAAGDVGVGQHDDPGAHWSSTMVGSSTGRALPGIAMVGGTDGMVVVGSTSDPPASPARRARRVVQRWSTSRTPRDPAA